MIIEQTAFSIENKFNELMKSNDNKDTEHKSENLDLSELLLEGYKDYQLTEKDIWVIKELIGERYNIYFRKDHNTYKKIHEIITKISEALVKDYDLINIPIFIDGCYTAEKDYELNTCIFNQIKLKANKNIPELKLIFNDQIEKISLKIENDFQMPYKTYECTMSGGKNYEIKFNGNDTNLHILTNNEFTRFSNRLDFFHIIEYFIKSNKIENSETLLDYINKENGVIITTYNTKNQKYDEIKKTSTIIETSNMELNVSYINPKAINNEVKQAIRDKLSKSKAQIKKFSAGWKYANQLIEFNDTNEDKILRIINNLELDPQELDKLMEATKLFSEPTSTPKYLEYPKKPDDSKKNPDNSNPDDSKKNPDNLKKDPDVPKKDKWGFKEYFIAVIISSIIVVAIIWFIKAVILKKQSEHNESDAQSQMQIII